MAIIDNGGDLITVTCLSSKGDVDITTGPTGETIQICQGSDYIEIPCGSIRELINAMERLAARS